jgi:outer membrane receptor for ferrienterochelin and colicin
VGEAPKEELKPKNPVEFHYEKKNEINESNFEQEYKVDIPTGDKTFLTLGVETNQDKEDKKYKVLWGFRFK